ncbi:hypothetical protein BGZ96_005083 [Linnemannia gamsii]|uniref:HCP-like protein n=1 Tax=Linnemannia gamsii TaxID=64522 RepID=A0ABQ7K691_9FUNG|nr:hypothetical protein BGZ96_005083 [Linnemannia gamsii]
MEEHITERVQAVRPVQPNSSKSEIVHFDIHQDPSGNNIVLWTDILAAFKGALCVRNNTKNVPFLKDIQFNIIEPRRFAAIPSVVLDILIEDSLVQEQEKTARVRPAESESLPPAKRKRGPQKTDDDVAFCNWNTLAFLPSDPKPPSDDIDIADGDADANKARSPQTLQDVIMETVGKAKAGDLSAQVELGIIYKQGNLGITQNLESAMDWFLLAANQGSAKGQYQVGCFYHYGLHVPKDHKLAAEWFLKAGKQYHTKSQVLLGVMYLDGDGVPKDHHRALQWLLPPAMEGNSRAQYHIGFMYESGEGLFPKDYSKAMEWYLKSADQGDKKSQVKIGFLYYQGRDVHKDHEIALEWFLKAAKQGDYTGQVSVGMCYEHGQGTENYPKAMEWYHKAAEKNFPIASFCVGRMYENGRGVEKDLTKAREWYLKGAEEGSDHAQASIAEMYCSQAASVRAANPGEAKELYEKAAVWYKKAAAQDSGRAQWALAEMYRDGRGVYQSFSRAKELFQILEKNGERNATGALQDTCYLEAEAEQNGYF